MIGNLHFFNELLSLYLINLSPFLVEKFLRDITLSENIVLRQVLYIHEFKVNLIAMSKLVRDNNLTIKFNNSKCYFQDNKLGKLIGQDDCNEGLYFFKQAPLHHVNSVSDVMIWHKRLSHLSS